MRKIYVIKVGGNVIDNSEKLQLFLSNFAQIQEPKILIHGGGKIATQVAKGLGIENQMVDGRRITDEPMLNVVKMVYGGLINKQVVGSLQALKCNALGLTGADGNAVLARKRPVKEIDYGFVGDIEKVNADFIKSLLSLGVSPVFAPLTYDINGQILNTNADTMAAEIAKALTQDYKVNLIYCFEKKGVLRDAGDDTSVIEKLNKESYEKYKSEGAIYAGMIPKLDNAFQALSSGVANVIICEADDILEAQKGKQGTLISL